MALRRHANASASVGTSGTVVLSGIGNTLRAGPDVGAVVRDLVASRQETPGRVSYDTPEASLDIRFLPPPNIELLKNVSYVLMGPVGSPIAEKMLAPYKAYITQTWGADAWDDWLKSGWEALRKQYPNGLPPP